MWPFLIPIVAILAWAIVESSKHRAKGGLSDEAERLLQALGAQIDEGEAERQRLRERIQNLEAIVTSETYELDRTTARLGTELPEAGGRPPLALDEPLDADEAEREVARQARRLRQR